MKNLSKYSKIRPLFGPSGHAESFAAEGHTATLDMPAWLSARGLDIFEYSFGRGVHISSKAAEQIGEESAKFGIEMSVHAPYFINFASPEPEKAENSVRYILSSLKILRCFGGERCVFHAGAQGGAPREEAFARTKDMFSRCLEAVAEEGYDDLLLCPETMGKGGQIGTVEEVVELCNLAPNVYPCVDFGHINALWGGALKTAADFEDVVKRYAGRMNVEYFNKENGGPAAARNFGAQHAKGEYLIILDSDVVVPQGYLAAIDEELVREACDAFGGPDRAAESFTPVQKAISYSMTSFFTTGGIRGGKKKMDKFYPRSFNMGIRRDVYTALGGFAAMRFGEDIDFSYRIVESGYKVRLFPDAWVWHKRRTDFRKFFKQVHNSGIARINLEKRHPGSMKLVHTLPAVFTLGCAALLAGELFCKWSLVPLALYALLVLADCTAHEKSLRVGLLAIAAAFVQLIGYGTGFWIAAFRRYVLKQDEFAAFSKNFYK